MSQVLPSRVLPSRALLLINEYSKPLTRSDWRESKPIISTRHLYLFILNHNINNYEHLTPIEKLHNIILYNISYTDWYALSCY